MIFSRNDSEEKGQASVIAAVGKNFESANAAVMYHARKLIQGDKFMTGQQKFVTEGLVDSGVKADWMENWPDGLTYCTWNGLGQNLNEQKIYSALDALKENGIQSKFWSSGEINR